MYDDGCKGIFKMRLSFSISSFLGTAALLCGMTAVAQEGRTNVMRIDATAPVMAPQPVAAMMGNARDPHGHVIGVNSQYLTMDGKPWIPVMGEFHFSRYPEAEWEQEILKMKAAGVGIVATYVIWIHHEQTEGVFDWSGQKDLRKFVELCGKHGMYVYPRIGPWAHAEVRNGGFPDWVLKAGPVRQNDPTYLAEVQSFYAEIGKQLKGELWKDGGPVIGIQIENEYRAKGPGKGDEHIRKLKAMAIADGMDVPLYTVTGWDGTAIPLDAVLPVFGGYPDAPWDGSAKALPANEVYAFRFDNRAAGSMGAIGGRGQNAASSYKGTPFLTAEVGDGIEDTYFRRPVVSADDVAAIAPIMLGSGANLLGYYMFHGGRNPDGGAITLQESQATGYPTDVPEKSYDFQAPLGEYGQEAASLRKLKLVHYFLQDFGSELAPMTARPPERVPASPTDASMVRVSARTDGKQGFVFVSNYVRGLTMPMRKDFQVELALPDGTVRIPETPMDLPAGSFGIWPVNLKVGATTLRYSTAQLFKRVGVRGKKYMFFFALPGVVPEFVVDGRAKVTVASGVVKQERTGHATRIRVSSANADVELDDGTHLVLMPEAEAEDVWKVDDPSVLLKSKAYAISDGQTWTMLSTGEAKVDVGVFSASAVPRSDGPALRKAGRDGLFEVYSAEMKAMDMKPQVTKVADAKERAPWRFGPVVAWRKQSLPMAPDDRDFATAAVWRIVVPAMPKELSDVFLRIHYAGDAARVLQDGSLVDDNFWNGLPWTVGLREIGDQSGGTLELKVLPLPKVYPMYLERGGELQFHGDRAVGLEGVELVPQYRLVLHEMER
jgi:beta-galactosidase